MPSFTQSKRRILPSYYFRVLVIAALIAVATARYALAAGTLGQMATGFSLDAINFGAIVSWLLYILGGAFVVGSLAAMAARHKGSHSVPWSGVFILFVAGVLCISAPALMGAGAQSLTGAAPGIDFGTAAQPIQWQ